MAPRRTWLLSRKAEDEDSQWEAFLSSKREALSRMKAGRQEALRRLGSERTEDRSISISVHDDRDATESQKENSQRSTPREPVMRGDFAHEARDDPASIHHERGEELDQHRLVEIFTVIEKRRWDELAQFIRMYPTAASFPCPKNLRTSAKGNMMLHEACRNNPPPQVVVALIAEFGDAVKAKGGKGYLPLHYACATGASLAVIERLVTAFPASIRTRDTNDLMIPLHFACKWGASTDVIDYLVKMHPEGKQVRDIYAKTPSDYASDLGEEREAVLATLGRSLSMSGSEVSSINLNDDASDANRELRRELTSTKSKLKKVTRELNNRERKFSLMYGQEKEKAYELEKQKELLEHECFQARLVQEEQAKKIKLLEQEFRTLKSLQETHGEKKSMLEKQIEHLQKEQSMIGDFKTNQRVKDELNAALKEQETKYQTMLQAEKEKIQDLESRAREAELTHRHYTMALLQEHEKEVSKFEELTSRFKVLESQLRREIENEKTKRINAQNEVATRGSEFKQALENEKEKVAFLEGHISKVNDLLEAEQKRFFELEGILKETLALENEQREEMEAEFQEKENQYQARIDVEARKRQQLEEAYADVAEKLKAEIDKTAGIQAYEFELKKELEADQIKLAELQKAHEENLRLLMLEQKRAKNLEEAEADARAKLKAEQVKVEELEKNHEKIYQLLEIERASAAQLRDELKELQDVYEKELNKVRRAQQAESSARSELRSLHERVSSLEEEEAAIKSKATAEASRLEISVKECELLKSMLESERDRVETLSRSQEELRELLEIEKQRVKNLEQAQVVQESQVEAIAPEEEENMEAQLMDSQVVLIEKRSLLSQLEGDYRILNGRFEQGRKSIEMLEKNVRERDQLMQVEKSKFDSLLKEHADIQAELNAERKKTEKAKKDALRFKMLLEVEQDTVKELQQMVDQAKVDLASKIEELRTIEEDETISRNEVVFKTGDLKMTVKQAAQLKEALAIEQQRVVELTAAQQDLKQLLEKEKERIVECENLLEAQKHLSIADQSKIQELEKKLEDIESSKLASEQKVREELNELKVMFDEEKRKSTELMEGHALITKELKDERKKYSSIDQDIARKDVLLESEQNKVKALEHSCDQLMSLLDWEKKHVLSLQEKQQELENDKEANEEEISELKQDLEESQNTIDDLTLKLITFDRMKKEIIRLTAAAQQRDIMLAAMLHSIGDAAAIRRKAPFQRAEIYVHDRERIVGLDLAGLDDDIVKDRNSRALVTYNEATRMRTLGRVVLPLIPIGGLIAYHHHDPTLLRDLSLQAGELSMALRGNIVDMSQTISTNLVANMGELAARIDASGLREPVVQSVAQVVGLATQTSQRINIRRMG
ncbi:ankyrin repeat domain protein [Nitzschia inconspicua]|uniref:Ankyrin repeat domain protein n=1 Tax=Nitzschia inconspicua TaxID=303405 RepID=A0A9K3KKA5_9STRA|nr:ankyrin repeat domain protein [Nitzschia inconspicua]